MRTGEFTTITNDHVEGIIVKEDPYQNYLIIQDKEGYFHVVFKEQKLPLVQAK